MKNLKKILIPSLLVLPFFLVEQTLALPKETVGDPRSEALMEQAYVKKQLKQLGYFRWSTLSLASYQESLSLSRVKLKSLQHDLALNKAKQEAKKSNAAAKKQLEKLALTNHEDAKKQAEALLESKKQQEQRIATQLQQQQDYANLIKKRTFLLEKINTQLKKEERNMQQNQAKISALLKRFKQLQKITKSGLGVKN